MKELLSIELAMIIAKNLAEVREKANLTKKEAAEKIGITASMYAKYETGAHLMSLTTLVKISRALNVGVEELLKGSWDGKINGH